MERERKGAPLFIVGNIARQHATETERVFIAMTVTSFLPASDLALHSTHAKQSRQLILARGDAISVEEEKRLHIFATTVNDTRNFIIDNNIFFLFFFFLCI